MVVIMVRGVCKKDVGGASHITYRLVLVDNGT